MPDNDLTSTKRYAIGIKYKMDVQLTRLIPKDQTGKAIVANKIFNDYFKVSYIDAGEFSIRVFDKRFSRDTVYPIRSDFGNKLGTRVDDTIDVATVETGSRHVSARGRTEDIEVHIVNEGNLDSRVASISQHATVVPS